MMVEGEGFEGGMGMIRDRLKVDGGSARGRDASGTLVKESEAFAIRAGWRAESSLEAVNELKVSAGEFVSDVVDGGGVDDGAAGISNLISGRTTLLADDVNWNADMALVPCWVSDGGNPSMGRAWPAAASAWMTEAQPCSSTLIRSRNS